VFALQGDGRYLITNGKDQTIKLWDMRHMARPNAPEWRQSAYDYRFMAPSIAPQRLPSLPDDTSLRTYTGHRVVRTLIRAKFSPATSTGQQYIYSGSADGNIYGIGRAQFESTPLAGWLTAASEGWLAWDGHSVGRPDGQPGSEIDTRPRTCA